MRLLFLSLPFCMLALAGCGAGGSTDTPPTQAQSSVVTVPAITVTSGIIPPNVDIIYGLNTDSFVLVGPDGSVVIRRSQMPPADLDQFDYYATSTSAVFAGETAGGSRATVINSPTAQIGITATILDRTGDTAVPETGTATYSGDYVGFLSFASDGVVALSVAGDVELTANFSDATVSGTITNRSHAFRAQPFEDVTFATGQIENGAFTGTTSGGRDIGSSNWTTEDGVYSGIFTGANGQEAIGSVQLVHRTGTAGTEFIEQGAFIAD